LFIPRAPRDPAAARQEKAVESVAQLRHGSLLNSHENSI